MKYNVSNYNIVPRIPDQVLVLDGVIDVTNRGRTTHHRDANNVEEWLRNQRLESPEGDLIRKTLERRGLPTR